MQIKIRDDLYHMVGLGNCTNLCNDSHQCLKESLLSGPTTNPLCVLIIPCYNEASRLPVDAITQFLQTHQAIHLLFVNDGSTDQTLDVLHKLANKNPNASLLNLDQNQGKAESVRQGVLKAQASNPKYIGYWDADLSAPLNELHAMIDMLEQSNTSIVIGSRFQQPETDIQRNVVRHYLGRLFTLCTKKMIRTPIYDTQCGAKLFSTDIVPVAFGQPFLTRWLFDVEMLLRLEKHFMPTQENNGWLVELPLQQWHAHKESKVTMMTYINAPYQLLKIQRHYKRQT